MFRKARIKLTAWYLLIIMAISLSFSAVIFYGVNVELTRIEHTQQTRQEERKELGPILKQLGQERQSLGLPPLPIPRNFNTPDPALVAEARTRLLTILGIVNLAILGVSAVSGYFLAGRTLEPIAEMVEEQKDFVSNASHELRTPLTSLKSEIEVALRDKKMTLAEARATIKSNLEEVDRMNKLSNYLLALNKYQNGKASLATTRIILGEVISEAVEKTKPLAKAKGITIKLNLKRVQATGNKDSLVQLATILLDNAIKYSPKGKKVKVSVRSSGRHAVMEVADEGIGIPAGDMPHIFDRFYRAETSRNKEETDGYGLGLSIAKSIVDAHGGKISVKSRLGRGSTFTVSL